MGQGSWNFHWWALLLDFFYGFTFLFVGWRRVWVWIYLFYANLFLLQHVARCFFLLVVVFMAVYFFGWGKSGAVASFAAIRLMTLGPAVVALGYLCTNSCASPLATSAASTSTNCLSISRNCLHFWIGFSGKNGKNTHLSDSTNPFTWIKFNELEGEFIKTSLALARKLAKTKVRKFCLLSGIYRCTRRNSVWQLCRSKCFWSVFRAALPAGCSAGFPAALPSAATAAFCPL